ncbi:hypothetical protein EDB80DRAFT_882025 [Ilyonectria destructans]|nr:hypothetical protein EDB80DRAFT_882025 [Ilyonectria destructans]
MASGSVAAKSAKIQYYYDGGCSNYAVEFNVEAFTCMCVSPIFPTPRTNRALYFLESHADMLALHSNYGWGNSNSGNIAGCETGDCTCTFYENAGCSGSSEITSYDGPFDNCASRWGKGFKSVRCRIY